MINNALSSLCTFVSVGATMDFFFFFACLSTVNLFIVCFYHLPGGMYTHTATRKECWSPPAGSSRLVPTTVHMRGSRKNTAYNRLISTKKFNRGKMYS